MRTRETTNSGMKSLTDDPMTITTDSIPIAGLTVHVHSIGGINATPDRPAVVVFLLHGRTGKAQSDMISELAASVLHGAQTGSDSAKQLLIVTFVRT